jgi:S-(hydroxymethyl)glutathione dehydrogenase/alcohol dehydrogenase
VATGVGAVRNTAQVPSGASVAVVGSGGVGLNSIECAALAGAHPVTAIDVPDSKLRAARLFGATDVINSSGVDAREAVRSLTAGRGADFTFITSGSPPAIELGLGLSRRAGTVVIVGMTGNGVTVAVDPGRAGRTAPGACSAARWARSGPTSTCPRWWSCTVRGA